MTNSTETYWSVDGQSLQTYAWNIETLGGDRNSARALRGSDLVIPSRPGSVWTPRVVDAHVVTLGMWVQGSNPDGTIPTDENARRTFDANWRMLRALLWRPRQQFTLGKQFWVPAQDLADAGAEEQALAYDGSWALIHAEAKASFAGGLVPSMNGPSHAAFTVDLRLSDPYFYGAPISVDFSATTGAGLPGPLQEFFVLGDDRTTKIGFALEGPLTTPRFTSSLTEAETWIQYTYPIADGDEVSVDVSTFESVHTETTATFRSPGYVSHRGDASWFYLDPGPAKVNLTVQEGTGTGTLTYRPAWL